LIKTNPADCHEQDKDGLTPLHHAARGNFLKIIQALLEAGAGEDAMSFCIYITVLCIVPLPTLQCF